MKVINYDLVKGLPGEIAALKARIVELEAAQQWQPIETAPKGDPDNLFDMPEVDLLLSRKVRATNCFYDHSKASWVMKVRYLTRSGSRKIVYNRVINSTHWRPIPQPPKEEKL